MNRVLSLVLVAGVAFSLGHFLRTPIPLAGAVGGGGGRGAQEGEYFACADSNGDGLVNVADPVYTLRYLFSEAPEPRCEAVPGVSLPATGVTKCYDNEGNEIDCSSADFPGQDGFYQAGCPTEGRFVDNGDGTVTDNCTGLMWQKEMAPGAYAWQAGLKYCEGLDLAGHTDWRLPNIRELHSLVDYGRQPAIHPVLGTFPHGCLSCTTKVSEPDKVWSQDFSNGWLGFGPRDALLFVRAVRTIQPGE